MDKTGNGVEVDMSRLAEVTELNFRQFQGDMFLYMCILSGCDYLDSIKGIGFKKAYKLVYEHGENLSKILLRIRREGKYLIPHDYEKSFEQALLTFKFQLVYCP
jgi:exonuclease-1